MRQPLALLMVIASAAAARAETVRLEPFVLGIPGVTKIANAGDGTGRLFFAQQGGVIFAHDNGQLLPQPLLDLTPLVLSGLEDGLLGLAFHPGFASNGYFYVLYTKLDTNNVVVRYRVSASDPNVADFASAFVVLELSSPNAGIHNGGELLFGPDRKLYISTGDDAIAADAQNLGSLMGKILRIDVEAGSPYAIPPDNPFVGVAGARPEIFAYGLRNPWRMSFDRATGDLLIGDNATAYRSEIDLLPEGSSGQNLGWPIMEGDICFPPPTTCSTAGLTLPAFAVSEVAIVGGYRYRGGRIPLLQGVYVYGYFSSQGALRGARQDSGGAWTTFPLVETDLNFLDSAYGEDESGDLLVANYSTFGAGAGIYRIVASSAPSTASVDETVTHQATEGGAITWTVKLSVAHLAGPVTVGYETADGTAVAGQDYVATTGTLTFAPGITRQQVTLQTVDDGTNEARFETFLLRLTAPGGVVIGDGESTGTIEDDDPYPTVSAGLCAVTEGDSGTAPCAFELELDQASGQEVRVTYFTQGGTASAVDYQPTSGSLTFLPGEQTATVAVSVVGDTVPEDNETFELALFPTNAVAVASGMALIQDDDAVPAPGVELAHGSVVRADHDLSAPDIFRVAQAPASSYELVLDENSGDAAGTLLLQRLSADGTTVVQSAAPTVGGATRLRWANSTAGAVLNQSLRVSASCFVVCGPDDRYRLRLYDTTLTGARFNNSGSQTSVLIVQNTERRSVQATAWFWRSDGAFLRTLALPLAPGASAVWNTSQVTGLAGKAGSVTIAHDGGYGALAGKLVAVEPASGFSFDTPLLPRAR